MTLRCIAALSIALVCMASPAPGAGADLSPKFKKGQELHYLNSTDMEMIQTMPSADAAAPETKTVIKSESGLRFKVLDAKPDGAAQLEWTILFMTMNMTGGPMPIDYDSRDPAKQSSPMAMMFKPMINNPAVVSIDGQGEVTDFKGMDAASMGPMGQMVGQFFSKEAFQQMGLLPTAQAPKPAEIGATWSDHLEIDLPQGMGTMLHDAEYKLSKVDAGANQAEIDVTRKSSMKKPDPAASQPAGQPSLAIEKGESSGSIQWDTAEGQMAATETNANLVMGVTTPMGTVSMKQKVKSSVKRTTLAEFKLAAASADEKPAAHK